MIQEADQLVSLIRQKKTKEAVTLKVYRVPGLAGVLEDAEQVSQLEKGEYLDISVTPRVMGNAAGL